MKAPKTISFYFLLVAICGMLALLFFVFKPFLYSLILAAVFGVIFQPLYTYFVRVMGKREAPAAAATTLAVVLVIIVPLTLLGTRVFQEAFGVYTSLRAGGGANALLDSLRDIAGDTISLDMGVYLQSVFDWIVVHFASIFSGIVKFGASIVIFVMALYYALKDGHRFRKAFVALSPLADEDDEEIVRTLGRAVSSVVVGRLAIALLQGLLAMAGFFAFSVPNPFLWGSVASITALIPGVGTALVVLPAALHLFLTGAPIAAAGLALWGVGVVGLVDNIVGPKLIGRGIPIHSFVILLSVLGGIGLFGPMGFVLGPLSVSLLFALLDAYRKDAVK